MKRVLLASLLLVLLTSTQQAASQDAVPKNVAELLRLRVTQPRAVPRVAPVVRITGTPAPPENPWVSDLLMFAVETSKTIGASGKSRHLVFNQDGSLIATDQPPTIWDAATMRPVAMADVYPRHSTGVALLDNGDLIAGSVGSFGVYRRQGRRLELLNRVGPSRAAIGDSPYLGRRDQIHWNNDRKLLFVPGPQGTGATVFDLSDKYPKAVSQLALPSTVAITNDFTVAAYRERNTVIVAKRSSTDEAFEEFDRKRGSHFRLSSNGVLVTIGHGVFVIEKKELRQIANLESVSNVAFFRDSKGFAYVTRGPNIKIVRLNVNDNDIANIPVEVVPTALAFSPSGQRLATVDPQVGLRLYEFVHGRWKETNLSSKRIDSEVPLKVIKFVDANRLLCQRTSRASDKRLGQSLVCVDVRSGELAQPPTETGVLKPIAFNARKTNYRPHGPGVLAARRGVRLSMEFENHNHPVACLRIGDDEQSVRSWSIQDLREASINSDADRMAVGTYAGLVHLVDLSKIEDEKRDKSE